ncbi:MAG: sigma-70 family RNA polymerase sigma factor [Calditrichaeota bacterium]|nr:sigma-70 family RNA polymerase sigma factor [Calditrichota bacterium]
MGTGTNQDFDLIHDYQEGNEEAFTRLFKKYYPLIFLFLKNKGMPETEAEDCTAEIFVKLIDALKVFRFEKPFENFLHRIARNKIIDFYRKKKIEICSLTIELATEAQSGFLEISEIEEIVNICLQQIKSQIRRAIILSWLEGYTRKQIAKLLSLPLGTVHSNLERGKVNFKKCIKEKL